MEELNNQTILICFKCWKMVNDLVQSQKFDYFLLKQIEGEKQKQQQYLIDLDVERTPLQLLQDKQLEKKIKKISSYNLQNIVNLDQEMEFQVQELKNNLKEVLVAISNADKSVGYVQGNNFIVQSILAYFEPEDTFYIMMSILKNYKLSEFQKNEMENLGTAMKVLDFYVWENLRFLDEYFINNHLDCSVFAVQWFQTLFQVTFQSNQQKIMDLFAFQGWKIIFKIALSIFKLLDQQLQKVALYENFGLEQIQVFDLLEQIFQENSIETILNMAVKDYQ
ncbi:Rab-GTPase-TBC domain [Pseudocohnilembus persalinus]|uniref:Rab-GTPase-TBC domain n=1 Tax=Pseudocohnilembus persalinus TaxID=266149 RepID=A0A0V0R8U3_PSEPJ|nr:Rab-GTPase-TBC domain [Pseudocohnilembus persalinus]|eukprot:KRX10897.1 Rab-GTPase-TBC domain [Pseudocohnilembus persalinus]